MIKHRTLFNLVGVSLAALSAGAFAQTPVQTPPAAGSGLSQPDDTATQPSTAVSSPASPASSAVAPTAGDDIIVTARRRDESAQDVPISINAVTGSEIAKLNLRQFEDVATTVPGLTLANSANGTAGSASLRGIAFDPNVSGANPSVEFYFNDGPISSNVLFTGLFDIGQIEVLRGPQGTLRGRASPSGSITVTSKQADLNEIGGYVNFTGNHIGSINANAAVGVPIIRGVLAVRIAGIVDENEGSRVTSINNPLEPTSRTKGGRASFRFDPTDSISILGDYQRIERHIRSFDQVESTGIAANSRFATIVPINASDRLAVQDTPRIVDQTFQTYNLQASWAFAGQRLNYVGALTKQRISSGEQTDIGDFFGTAYGPRVPNTENLQNFARNTLTTVNNQAHEVRLSSEERVFGIFDYIVGGFYNRAKSPTSFVINTPVFLAPVTAANPAIPTILNKTFIGRRNRTVEKSVFGNITAHLGEKAEISGGARYINYKKNAGLLIGTTATNLVEDLRSAEDVTFNKVIYSAVGKYQFTPDLMAYASVGSSFRPGTSVIGDNSLTKTDREAGFLNLPPESSTSYEVGFKSSLFDRRVKLNVSAFHQDFKNYPFRVSNPVFFVSNEVLRAGTPAVDVLRSFNFAAAVPVKVDGIEAEMSVQIMDRWSIGGSLAYSRSRIKNGIIPCNDFFPANGVPDTGSAVPTVAQIRAATGGNSVAACNVKYNPSLSPPLSGVIQSEYSHPVSGNVDGYLRGLVSLYGKSKVDPSTTIDDVEKYGLINLYAGIRDADNAWEVSFFAKNVTKVDLALTRTASPSTTSYATLAGSQTGVTSYRGGSAASGLTYTAPREFGLNLRYAFGSR